MNKLTAENPLINELVSTQELFWMNPSYKHFQQGIKQAPLGEKDIIEAENRLLRFAPYIKKAFPETKEMNGIIESPIKEIQALQQHLEEMYSEKLYGKWLLKCDHDLPISGSIKARGGIYEVLKHAEELAVQYGLLGIEDDYSLLDSKRFKEFYSKYAISVGSTGNLGLSIGIIGAKLGFKVTVHMSADAKKWKKELLRSKGVNVVEYESDYSKAVNQGRIESEKDPLCYFIDDENSQHLFVGYAVAALRLKNQLESLKIKVDSDHPLFVYLPCGVGGGPGGVAFGLKLIYEDHVHAFFAEPTHSPGMLLGMLTGLHDKISVQDIGIDNITAADGLAVGRPSGFVGKTMEHFLSGCFTVSDHSLYKLLYKMAVKENIFLEPSALAGVFGPVQLFKTTEGKEYIQYQKLQHRMKNATHIVWATGGGMVPKAEMEEYMKAGFSEMEKM
ncbi:D-serine ammonia-lyase [Jeotgalibacillus soli]|nr:D-serine ammonia-lyase [Jeotgalibacillus soli]